MQSDSTFNISQVAFCSYCFGTAYLDQQVRLQSSILAIYPNANLHFINDPEETGKPKFQQSLYGFKPRLVRHCISQGFRRVVFFDTAITLVGFINNWFELVKTYGVLAPIDRQKLNNVTSNNCMAYEGKTREQLADIQLVGGSVYVFDFDVPKCCLIFNHWEKMEKDGMFGTQDDLSHDRLQSHRMDETCMALSLHRFASEPLGHDVLGYAYEHPETKAIHGTGYEITCLKKHFK